MYTYSKNIELKMENINYYCQQKGVKRVRVMMFNATFNNISVISWWSVYNG